MTSSPRGAGTGPILDLPPPPLPFRAGAPVFGDLDLMTLTDERQHLGRLPFLKEDAHHPLTHAAEQIVRDRLRPRRNLVESDPRPSLLAPEHDLVAERGFLDLRCVDHRDIHRDPPHDGRALA